MNPLTTAPTDPDSRERLAREVADGVGAPQIWLADDAVTGPINLGNPGEFTMIELAENVIDLTNSSSKLVFEPLPSDDPTQRQPDISLAKEKLGWEPVIKLEQGLASTIDYFKTVVR